MYRPIMNPIDAPVARRPKPQPVMQPQEPDSRQKVAQALMSPPQSAFVYGRNFDGMFNPAQTQPQPMGRTLRPAKGMR